MENRKTRRLMGLFTIILALLMASCAPAPDPVMPETPAPPHKEEGALVIDIDMIKPESLPGGKLSVKLDTVKGPIEKSFTLGDKARESFRIENIHEGKLGLKAELSDSMGTVLIAKNASIWMIGGGEEHFGIVLSNPEKASVTFRGTPDARWNDAIWTLEVSKSGEDPSFVSNGKPGNDASFSALLPPGTWNWKMTSVNDMSGMEAVTGGVMELVNGKNDDIAVSFPEGTGTLLVCISGYDPAWNAVLKLNGPEGEILEENIDGSGMATFESLGTGNWTVTAESLRNGKVAGTASENVTVTEERRTQSWLNMVWNPVSLSVSLTEEDIASMASVSRFDIKVSGEGNAYSFPILREGRRTAIFRSIVPGSYSVTADAVMADGSVMTVASATVEVEEGDVSVSLPLVADPATLTVKTENGGRTNSYKWEISIFPFGSSTPLKKTATASSPEFVFEALKAGKYRAELRIVSNSGTILAYQNEDIVLEGGEDLAVTMAPEFKYDYATLALKLPSDNANPAATAVHSVVVTVRSTDGTEYGSRKIDTGRYAEFRLPQGKYNAAASLIDRSGRVIASAEMNDIECTAGVIRRESFTPVYEKSNLTVLLPSSTGGWMLSLENRDSGWNMTLPESVDYEDQKVAEIWPGTWIIKVSKPGEMNYADTVIVEKGENTAEFSYVAVAEEVTVTPVIAAGEEGKLYGPWTIKLIDGKGFAQTKTLRKLTPLVFQGIYSDTVKVSVYNNSGTADGFQEKTFYGATPWNIDVEISRPRCIGEFKIEKNSEFDAASTVRMTLSSDLTGESFTESFYTFGPAVWKPEVPYGNWNLLMELLDADGNAIRTMEDRISIPAERTGHYRFSTDTSDIDRDEFILKVIWNDPEGKLPAPDEYEVNGAMYPAGKNIVLTESFDKLSVKAFKAGVVIDEYMGNYRWTGTSTVRHSLVLGYNGKRCIEVLIPQEHGSSFLWDEAKLTLTSRTESRELDLLAEGIDRMSYTFNDVPNGEWVIEAVFSKNGYPVLRGRLDLDLYGEVQDRAVELKLKEATAKVKFILDGHKVEGIQEIYFGDYAHWNKQNAVTEAIVPCGVYDIEVDILGKEYVLMDRQIISLDVKEDGQEYLVSIDNDSFYESYLQFIWDEEFYSYKLWYLEGEVWHEMHNFYMRADFRSFPGDFYDIKGEAYDFDGNVIYVTEAHRICAGEGINRKYLDWTPLMHEVSIAPKTTDEGLLDNVVEWVVRGNNGAETDLWKFANDYSDSMKISVRNGVWNLSIEGYDRLGTMIVKGSTSTENGYICGFQVERPVSEVVFEVIPEAGLPVMEKRTMEIFREMGELEKKMDWSMNESIYRETLPCGNYTFKFTASSSDGTESRTVHGKLEVGSGNTVTIKLK